MTSEPTHGFPDIFTADGKLGKIRLQIRKRGRQPKPFLTRLPSIPPSIRS